MTTQILLIDPDIAFMVTLKQALESTGEFRVNIAANAAAAVDLLKITSYDAAVADFELPELDTLELLQMLRQVQRELPVLMMAHDEMHFERVRFLDVQGAIGKPFTARELIPYLRRMIDRAGPSITPPSTADETGDEFVAPMMPRSVQQVIDQKPAPSPTDLLDDIERNTFGEDSGTEEAPVLSETGSFNLSDEDLLAEFAAMEGDHADEDEDTGDAPDDKPSPAAEHTGTTVLDRLPDPSSTTALEWPKEPEETRNLPPEPQPSDTTALLEWQTPEETRQLADTDNLDTLISKHGWGIRQKPDTKPLQERPGAPGPPSSGMEPQDPNARFYDEDEDDSQDFGDVLNAVAESQPDDYRRPPGERAFHDLVDSLNVGNQPLPRRNRLEDLLTSIATDAVTGSEPISADNTLDYVLDAIRRSSAAEPAEPDEPVLPPPPPPDESEMDDTTIGDVIEGLFDPGFEGVLAALAGEDIEEETYDEPTYDGLDRITDSLQPRADDRIGLDAMQIDEDAPDWLTGIDSGEDTHTAIEEPSFSEDNSRHYRATAALNAVQGTEDEIDFSLHQLLDQIEAELPPARTRYPVLRPLPSWGEQGPITGGEDVAALFTRMESGEESIAPGTLPPSIARLLPDPLNEPPVSAQDTRPTSVVRAQREAEAGESGLAEGDDEDFEDTWALPDTQTTPAPASGWERSGDYPDALRDLASDVELEPPAAPSSDPGDMFSMDEFFALADLPIEAGTEEIKVTHAADEESHEGAPYDETDTMDNDTFTAAFYAGLHETTSMEDTAPIEPPPDEQPSFTEPAATFEDDAPAYAMDFDAAEASEAVTDETQPAAYEPEEVEDDAPAYALDFDAAEASEGVTDETQPAAYEPEEVEDDATAYALDFDAAEASEVVTDETQPAAYEPEEVEEEAGWPAEPAPLDSLGDFDWFAAPADPEQTEDDTQFDDLFADQYPDQRDEQPEDQPDERYDSRYVDQYAEDYADHRDEQPEDQPDERYDSRYVDQYAEDYADQRDEQPADQPDDEPDEDSDRVHSRLAARYRVERADGRQRGTLQL